MSTGIATIPAEKRDVELMRELVIMGLIGSTEIGEPEVFRRVQSRVNQWASVQDLLDGDQILVAEFVVEEIRAVIDEFDVGFKYKVGRPDETDLAFRDELAGLVERLEAASGPVEVTA